MAAEPLQAWEQQYAMALVSMEGQTHSLDSGESIPGRCTSFCLQPLARAWR